MNFALPSPPKLRPPSNVQTFRALRHREFRLLWFGSVVLAAGSWIQLITLGWLMYDRTGNALLVGILDGARAFPYLVIGPIGGVFTDRLDRRKMLLANQIFLSVTSLAFAGLVATDHAPPWLIIAFAFVGGAGFAIINPLRQAIAANLVPKEDLPNAIALISAANNINRVLGPAIGGILIAVFGATTNFLIQAVCYSSVAVIVFPIRSSVSAQAKKIGTSALADMREGLRFVMRERTIFSLIFLAALPSALLTPFTTGLMPVFAKDALHQDAKGLGILLSFFGLGALLGVLILASLPGSKSQKSQMTIQLISGIIASAALIALSRTTTLGLAIPCLIVEGMAMFAFAAMNNTHLQHMLPDSMRGRVMSIYLASFGFAPLGATVGGFIAERYGSGEALLFGGMISLLLVTVTCRRYRKELWAEPKLLSQTETGGKG